MTPNRPSFRRYGTAVLLVATMMATLMLAGCGERAAEIPEGAVMGEGVAPEVQRGVEAAAAAFLAQARGKDWSGIWAGTATQVQQNASEEQFLNSVRHVAGTVGIPASLETVSLAVVGFGPSFPPANQVEIPVEGEDYPLTLLLPNHPVQASLVQKSGADPDAFYYCTLWFLEAGDWKLATFFAKPATSYGHDWEYYADLAGDQRLEGNIRNAALLYNLAIDLVVPAAWIKPAEVERLERTQRRINVTQLPVGRVDLWASTPDTFRVVTAQYNVLPAGLGLIFGFESPVDPADAAGQTEYAEKLYGYILDEFPEYPRVFSTVTLQALAPGTKDPFWIRTYPLATAP